MKLKPFQREDIARMALHDSAICGLDTGLGKTLVAYVWPLLKVGLLRDGAGNAVRPLCPAEPVLIVANGDLHERTISEGVRHFGITPTLLDSQATFLRLAAINPKPQTGRRYLLPPGFYLANYTQLSRNGIVPFPKLDHNHPEALFEKLFGSPPVAPNGEVHTAIRHYYGRRGQREAVYYERLYISTDATLAELKAKWFSLRKNANEFERKALDEAYHILEAFAPQTAADGRKGFAGLKPDQKLAIIAQVAAGVGREFSGAIGETKYHADTDSVIKCVYCPSLADLCQDAFAAVVADEAVKIKGEETLMGRAVRQLNPRYRLPMTATPIKNRVPDIFRLAHWCAGNYFIASPRFPFGDADAEAFANAFSFTERNFSAEKRSKNPDRRFIRRTPQVCNIHMLWKVLAPLILRRRKQDCGEMMVQKSRNVVRVPMGVHQAAAYKFHLDARYVDRKGQKAIGAQLQALRIAAANPSSALLVRPVGDSDTPGNPRSDYPYIPKLDAALALIKQILDRREQAIVFSAFNDSLDALSGYLSEASVRHYTLDGRTSPARRGQIAGQFARAGSNIPITLQGVDCMAEGHSYPRCRNVILMAYSWAWDKFEQLINRIHRLDSIADVNVHVILCDGTIDRKLEGMNKEKGDAQELVLDGHLLGENPAEVNFAELLKIAQREFKAIGTAGSRLIDERELVKAWPALRRQLAASMRAWESPPKKFSVEVVPEVVTTPQPMKKAPSASAIDPRFADLPLWQQAA